MFLFLQTKETVQRRGSIILEGCPSIVRQLRGLENNNDKKLAFSIIPFKSAKIVVRHAALLGGVAYCQCCWGWWECIHISPEMHLNSDISKVMPWVGLTQVHCPKSRCQKVFFMQPVGIEDEMGQAKRFGQSYHLLLDWDDWTRVDKLLGTLGPP